MQLAAIKGISFEVMSITYSLARFVYTFNFADTKLGMPRSNVAAAGEMLLPPFCCCFYHIVNKLIFRLRTYNLSKTLLLLIEINCSSSNSAHFSGQRSKCSLITSSNEFVVEEIKKKSLQLSAAATPTATTTTLHFIYLCCLQT